jgi:hypothetical protein
MVVYNTKGAKQVHSDIHNAVPLAQLIDRPPDR